MALTYEDAISRVAERTVDNTETIKQGLKQRRHQVTDIYGQEIFRSGDKKTDADYYIAISPDLEYFERFAFKLYVHPDTTATGLNLYFVDENDVAHNITDYLVEQQEGEWITSKAGMYPSDEIESDDNSHDFYDLLDVASLMTAGKDSTVDQMLDPGLKHFRITASSGTFSISMMLFIKFSHTNR